MKTHNIKRNLRRGWPWGILLVLTAYVIGFAACGSNSTPSAPPPGTCTINCGGTGQNLVARAIGISFVGGTEQRRFEMGLSFYGSFASGQYPANDPTLFGSYSGPISATGWMSILVHEASSFCPLIPGNYAVRTLSPGIWGGNGPYSNASFSGITLEAVGNGQIIRLLLPNNFVYRATPAIRAQSTPENFDLAVGNSVFILSVNNMNCPNGINEYVLRAPGW